MSIIERQWAGDHALSIVRFTDQAIFGVPESLFVRRFPIFRCPHCGSICRVEEAKSLASKEKFVNKLFSIINTPIKVTYDDCIDSLASKNLNLTYDEVRRVRLLAFQVGNDLHRNVPDSEKIRPEDRPPSWRMNLLELAKLCRRDSPGEVALLAETHREMGDFMQSIKTIDIYLNNSDEFHNRFFYYDYLKHLSESLNPFVQKCPIL
jgi:hypothetical protein